MRNNDTNCKPNDALREKRTSNEKLIGHFAKIIRSFLNKCL